MKEIQAGEKAMAILGLSHVINKDLPRWTLGKMREFEKLPEKISEMAGEAIEGKIKLKDIPREHDYRATLDRLSEDLTNFDIALIQSKFPLPFDELSADFIVTAQNSWAHLREIFPISEYRSFAGVKNIQPTGDKSWQFFRRLMVLNDPMLVFMLISSGAMLKSDAAAVREFFPTFSAAVDDELYAAIAARTALKPDVPILTRVTIGLNNWLDRRSVDYDPDADKREPTKPVTGLPKTSGAGPSGLALSPTERINDSSAVKS